MHEIFHIVDHISGYSSPTAKIPRGDHSGQGGKGAHGEFTEEWEHVPEITGACRAGGEEHAGGDSQSGNQQPAGKTG